MENNHPESRTWSCYPTVIYRFVPSRPGYCQS